MKQIVKARLCGGSIICTLPKQIIRINDFYSKLWYSKHMEKVK